MYPDYKWYVSLEIPVEEVRILLVNALLYIKPLLDTYSIRGRYNLQIDNAIKGKFVQYISKFCNNLPLATKSKLKYNWIVCNGHIIYNNSDCGSDIVNSIFKEAEDQIFNSEDTLSEVFTSENVIDAHIKNININKNIWYKLISNIEIENEHVNLIKESSGL